MNLVGEDSSLTTFLTFVWSLCLFPLYQVICYTIFQILIYLIIGIIIDTFGSLREKDKEKIMDVQEICFTCGCDRYFQYIKFYSELFLEKHMIDNQTSKEDLSDILR